MARYGVFGVQGKTTKWFLEGLGIVRDIGSDCEKEIRIVIRQKA